MKGGHLDLGELAASTQRVYERNASRFDAERPKRLQARRWMDRFPALVWPGGAVLLARRETP